MPTAVSSLATTTDLEPYDLTSKGQTLRNGVQTAEAAAVTTGYQGYDHVHWYVGNAKQAASYYISRFGFKHVAYKGLETGSREIASHVVENGGVRFVLTSPLIGSDRPNAQDAVALKQIHDHLTLHGDGVKDVSFKVDDVRGVWKQAVERGAKSVREPQVLKDEDGEVVVATIQTYGDTTHTLIERSKYRGTFMPGYKASSLHDSLDNFLPKISLDAVDHCVGNQDWNQMEDLCV